MSTITNTNESPTKQNSRILSIDNMRRIAIEKNALLYSYCIFISSYFVAPHERIFKSIFYYPVFALFLLTANRELLTHLKRSLIFRYSLLWLGYLALTLFWSEDVQIRDVEKYVRGFLWIGIFLAVTIALSRQERLFPRYLFIAVASVSALMAVLAILYFYSTHQFPNQRLVGLGQLKLHALASAMFYGAASLMTAFGLVAHAHTARTRLLYGTMLAVLLAALVLTASRGPLLGVVLAISVGLVATCRWRVTLGVAGIGLTIVAMVTIVTVFTGVDIGPHDYLARGSSYRLEIWSNLVPPVLDAFWFGHGVATEFPTIFISENTIFASAHQMYLANHYYGGLPASLLLLMVLAAAVRTAYRRIRASGEFVYAALLIFLMIASMFYIDMVIKSANLVWFYVWLPLGLLAGQEALMNEKAASEQQ